MKWNFRWGKKQRQMPGLVGVSETATHIAAAYTVIHDGKVIVKGHFCAEAGDLAARQQLLGQFVAEHQLQGANCTYVLGSSDYGLSLVEAPLVAKQEIAHALRWLLKDSVNYPIEEAIIDCFDVPFVRAKDNVKMVYAASIHKDLVPKIQTLIEATGLLLRFIDIPELALRNIVNFHPVETKGCAFIALSSTGGKLILCRGEDLCITRSFDLKLGELGKNPNEDSGILESLALEVQRSFDYISSIFRQTIQNNIVLAPTLVNGTIVMDSLKSALGAEVFLLKAVECFSFEKSITEEAVAECLLAIGGSMRQEQLA